MIALRCAFVLAVWESCCLHTGLALAAAGVRIGVLSGSLIEITSRVFLATSCRAPAGLGACALTALLASCKTLAFYFSRRDVLGATS